MMKFWILTFHPYKAHIVKNLYLIIYESSYNKKLKKISSILFCFLKFVFIYSERILS